MSQDTEGELPPELRALEAELASLVPRTDGLDDACLMFVAGRASVRTTPATGRTWPAAFGAMTLVASALAVLLLLRPAPEIVERIVYVPVEPAGTTPRVDVAANREQTAPAEREPARERAVAKSPLAAPASQGVLASLFWGRHDEVDRGGSWKTSYPAMRDRILDKGLDSWPAPASDGGGRSSPPLSQRELLDQMIPEMRRPTAL